MTDTQQQQLLQPALFWSWLDRDNQPQLITGHDAPSPGQNEKCQKIDFSDAQLETMMCICDAKRLLDDEKIPDAAFPSREEQFTVCYRGMLAATEAGILLDDDRDAWVLKWLAEQYDITL